MSRAPSLDQAGLAALIQFLDKPGRYPDLTRGRFTEIGSNELAQIVVVGDFQDPFPGSDSPSGSSQGLNRGA